MGIWRSHARRDDGPDLRGPRPLRLRHPPGRPCGQLGGQRRHLDGRIQGDLRQDCRERALFFEGYDEAGKPLAFKEVHTQLDHDHRSAVMFVKGSDGAFVKLMEMGCNRAR